VSRTLFDVVVAGAGPAGTTAARCCAESGLSVLCLEEHGTIGYPVQCAGLLSAAAFREAGVTERCVQQRVRGARICPDRGEQLLIDAGETKAYVVDRGALDRELAEAAASAGAEFLTRAAVFRQYKGTVITRGPAGHLEFGYRILIAADGPKGTIARLLGMERPPVYLAGLQADLPCPMDGRFVDLYPDASPDFFGWAIPCGEDRARIGLAGRTGVKERFSAFIRRFGPRFSPVHLVTGTIPLGTMPVTYGSSTLFVGDAAGMAKPTSGGGVYTGIRSARHAAAVAAECCEANDFSDAALREYELRWKSDFGKDLAMGFRIFSLRQKIGPDDMSRIIQSLSSPRVKELIVRYGDMDRPGILVRKLLTDPTLLPLIAPLLRYGIRSLF
jgi:digeranylgeranylglycerophospholipid reductase